MELPLQITFRGIASSASLEDMIREHAGKLEKFHPHLISCRTVVEQTARHQRQGRTFAVHLDIKVRNAEIAITREEAQDPVVAVKNAFDAARRRLEDRARLQRRDVKRRAPDRSG